MKKFWKTLCILSASAFLLTNCEDVPAPYQAPGITDETGSGSYLDESFTNSLGDFVSQSTSGTLNWYHDYQSACITGYQDFDGDGQKENQAGVTYLISPAIDLSGSTGAYITFDHALNYERGDIAANHELLISKDYNGDAATATWEKLAINTEGTNSDFTFVNAGKISIPADYIGINPVYVALRHTCTDSYSSTWEVRNLKVVEGAGEAIEEPGGEEGATLFGETFDSGLGAFTIDNVKPAQGLGGEVWTYDSKYVCAKATSYTGGENGQDIPTESWLVSPVIDLTGASAATLTFDHAANYFNDVKTDVTVWITDAAQENWTQLNVPTYPTGFTFVNSGDIDLNAYKGKKVKIGFKYVCTTKAGTYELKNLLVQERQAEVAPEVPDTDESLTVAQAIARYDANKPQANVRVKGYIVGYVEGMSIDGATFGASGENVSNTNLMIADDVNETDHTKCLVIQLPSGNVRNALNLKENPENLGKEVTLLGSLEKYFGTYGLKSVSEYTLAGESTPVEKNTFTKVTTISDGTYIIAANVDGTYKVAQNIAADRTFGYLYVNDATVTNNVMTIDPARLTFTITSTANGYTIQDESGRYMIMQGSFDSWNLEESPTSGQYYTIEGNADGSFRITNTAMDKWMQFDENYDSFGSYANERGIMPCLFKKN